MKTSRLLLLCLILLLPVVYACQKSEEKPPAKEPEPGEVEKPEPEKPEKPVGPVQEEAAYTRFLALYQSGNYIERIETDGDSTRVCFSDQSRIAVHTQHKFAQEINGGNKPLIVKNTTGTGWLVDGKPSDISRREEPNLQKRNIVSLYYNSADLYLFLDNGFEMRFYIGPEEEGVIAFGFEKALNSQLIQSMAGERSGNYWVAQYPARLNNAKLIATVSYRGKRLTVKGIEQKSGETVNDFSSTVEYLLEKHDGTTVTYNVLQTFSKLPRITIKTAGNVPIVSKDEYINADIVIEDPYALYSDGEKIACLTEIRGRGNATWGWAKKPYKIKLAKKKPLLGMSNDRQWALIANHVDKSLMRGTVAFAISEMTGLLFSPKSRYADLFINNAYYGLYNLTEQPRVSDERVNVELVDKTGDVTGGYFLELDNRLDGTRFFRTDRRGVGFVFKEPEEPTDEQFNYIRQYMKETEDAIYGEQYRDPENGYAKYIDTESFADNYIIQELTKNADGYMILSSFFVKPRGEKLTHCNVWDFDLSLGNCSYISHSATDWYINSPQSAWYDQILQDPAFRSLVKERWNRIKSQVLQLPAFIDQTVYLINNSQQQNFILWKTLGTNTEGLNVKVPTTYLGEITYLKEFLAARTAWFDREVNKW